MTKLTFPITITTTNGDPVSFRQHFSIKDRQQTLYQVSLLSSRSCAVDESMRCRRLLTSITHTLFCAWLHPNYSVQRTITSRRAAVFSRFLKELAVKIYDDSQSNPVRQTPMRNTRSVRQLARYLYTSASCALTSSKTPSSKRRRQVPTEDSAGMRRNF